MSSNDDDDFGFVNNNDNIIDLLNLKDNELFDLLDEIESIKENIIVNKKENICYECKTSDKLVKDYSQGIIVCSFCGIVVSNILDDSPEWKQYADDKDTVGRCSQPTNYFLPVSSLSTTISCSGRNKVKMLQDWNAMPYKERSLNLVFKEIQNKCQKGNIVKYIEDDAKILYKNISDCKYTSGKHIGKPIVFRNVNRKGIIAACIFYSCKRNGRTRSPKEIANIFNLKSKLKVTTKY